MGQNGRSDDLNIVLGYWILLLHSDFGQSTNG